MTLEELEDYDHLEWDLSTALTYFQKMQDQYEADHGRILDFPGFTPALSGGNPDGSPGGCGPDSDIF